MTLQLLSVVITLLGNGPQPVRQDGNPNRPVIGQQVEVFTCHFEIAPGVTRDCTRREWWIGYTAWCRRYRSEHAPQHQRSTNNESDDAAAETRRDRTDFDRDMREVEAVDRAWSNNHSRRHRHRN